MRVIKTRDILQLNESYEKCTNRNTCEAVLTAPVINLSNSTDIDAKETTNENIDEIAGTLLYELCNLHTFYNPALDFSEKLEETQKETFIQRVQPTTLIQINRSEAELIALFEAMKEICIVY